MVHVKLSPFRCRSYPDHSLGVLFGSGRGVSEHEYRSTPMMTMTIDTSFDVVRHCCGSCAQKNKCEAPKVEAA